MRLTGITLMHEAGAFADRSPAASGVGMLTLAREARGFTQAELADRLSVAQGTLSKYETGVNAPPFEFVPHLSGFLGFPEAFFIKLGARTGFPRSADAACRR